ncbi:MAG: hypothetical protein WC479_11445 [Candidatus Izemoplasmatales bacterium]
MKAMAQDNSSLDLWEQVATLLGLKESHSITKTANTKIIKGVIYCRNCKHQHTQYFRMVQYSDGSWKVDKELTNEEVVVQEFLRTNILLNKLMYCYLCDVNWRLDNGWIILKEKKQ